ncbi:uncharacterized protein LOC142985130 [Anticarsia gemmatalis]|uniref:uncharacterized protein LOC142985130 n=1 Tax=Anticarsia gemmatalis TaxID=129554 RepID=UPI003F76DF74
MSGARYYVWGGGRWREVDVERGAVEGGRGRPRFVYVRRGKLHVASTRRVLGALQALAAGRPSAVRLGPRVPALSTEETGPSGSRSSLRVNTVEQTSATTGGDEHNKPHTCCVHSHGCNNSKAQEWCAASAGAARRCDVGVQHDTATLTLSLDHAPPRPVHPAGPAPAARPRAPTPAPPAAVNESRRRAPPLQSLLKHPDRNKRDRAEDNSGADSADDFERPSKTPRRQRRQEVRAESVCKELTISASDVAALRSFVARTRRGALERFDADDAYKRALFYAINPLVDVPRCPRTERALRERHHTALPHFAARLGLARRSDTQSPAPSAAAPRARPRRSAAPHYRERSSSDTDKENERGSSPYVMKRLVLSSDSEAVAGGRRHTTRSVTSATNTHARNAMVNGRVRVKKVRQNKPVASPAKSRRRDSSSSASETDDEEKRENTRHVTNSTRSSSRSKATSKQVTQTKSNKRQSSSSSSSVSETDTDKSETHNKTVTNSVKRNSATKGGEVNNGQLKPRKRQSSTSSHSVSETDDAGKDKQTKSPVSATKARTSLMKRDEKGRFLPVKQTKSNKRQSSNTVNSVSETDDEKTHTPSKTTSNSVKKKAIHPHRERVVDKKQVDTNTRQSSSSNSVSETDDENRERQKSLVNSIKKKSTLISKDKYTNREKKQMQEKSKKRRASSSSNSASETDNRRKETHNKPVVNSDKSKSKSSKERDADRVKKVMATKSLVSPAKKSKWRSRMSSSEREADKVSAASTKQKVKSKSSATSATSAVNRVSETEDNEHIHVISKRASSSRLKEYSNLEDHAIVAWVSSGGRARRVNGNSVWRELQEQFPALAGAARSWHSLRNRYLRYILPALGALRLPPAHVSRLRAAAATGEIKHKRRANSEAPRRNSIFKEDVVRAASTRRPRVAPDSEPEPEEPRVKSPRKRAAPSSQEDSEEDKAGGGKRQSLRSYFVAPRAYNDVRNSSDVSSPAPRAASPPAASPRRPRRSRAPPTPQPSPPPATSRSRKLFNPKLVM